MSFSISSKIRGFILTAVVIGGAAALAFATISVTRPLNNPKPLSEYSENTLFSSFSGRSPRTLDPQASYSSDETLYTYGIYEPPYGYHYLKRPYEITARAAESVTAPVYFDKDGNELSADAAPESVARSLYRITIRRGMKFAPHPAFVRTEGGVYPYHHLSDVAASELKSPLDLPMKATRELTAEDFVYGIKRMAAPKTVCPVLGLMSAHVPGLKKLYSELAKQKKDGWTDLRPYSVDGVRVTGRYSFEIDVQGKYPQFVNWLAMAFFAPVPWEAEAFYDNKILAQNNISLATWPVGAGPYMLSESRQNREHVMVRNPNYRFEPYPCEGTDEDKAQGMLADCGKPTPFIDKVVMTMEKEAVPTGSKFLQGYYDSPQVTRLDVGTGYIVAAGDSKEKAELYAEHKLKFPTSIEANISYLGFNWADPVVGEGEDAASRERNKKLRQAISIAIDWEEQIAIFEKGQGRSAHGPLPPGLFGWNDRGASAFNSVVYRKTEDGTVVRRSIEEAQKLMAEAGYPDGRDAKTGQPLVLNFDWQGAAPSSKAFLEWFVRQFAKIGIQLEIRATDYNRFQEKMNKGAAQIYFWGWLADYPDAENFLFLLYGPNSKVRTGGGGENASNYVNAEYDRLFDRMRYMNDTPEKAECIDRMIRILQEDAPWCFGYFPTSAAALQQWVENAKPTQIVRNNVQYMKIDTEVRRRMIAEWNHPVLWPLALLIFAVAAPVVVVRRVLIKKSRQKGIERRAEGRTEEKA